MPEMKFVAYYRVSTERQGRSGLGLDAQRTAVQAFLNGNAGILAAEFTETESGKGANATLLRPQLRLALAAAKKLGASLVIAKLDRLARNVAFIADLMNGGVEFVAVDNPNASRLTLHILAAVAEHEREMISERTRAALAAAKARGRVLGQHGRLLAAQNRTAARDRVRPLKPCLTAMRLKGLSIREIAAALNAQGVASPAGASWHPTSVHRALKRLEEC